MKTYIWPSIKLTAVLLLLCAALYPLLIAGIAKAAPGGGKGVTVTFNGKTVGYENLGQRFTADKYFQGRPSAVAYNAAGSGGSNKGPSNAEYLALVKARIDTFMVHNPGIAKAEIPAELVTASGSGLDPHLPVKAVRIQVPRVARARHIDPQILFNLIGKLTEKPWLGVLGPEKINTLKLNIALDSLQENSH